MNISGSEIFQMNEHFPLYRNSVIGAESTGAPVRAPYSPYISERARDHGSDRRFNNTVYNTSCSDLRTPGVYGPYTHVPESLGNVRSFVDSAGLTTREISGTMPSGQLTTGSSERCTARSSLRRSEKLKRQPTGKDASQSRASRQSSWTVNWARSRAELFDAESTGGSVYSFQSFFFVLSRKATELHAPPLRRGWFPRPDEAAFLDSTLHRRRDNGEKDP